MKRKSIAPTLAGIICLALLIGCKQAGKTQINNEYKCLTVAKGDKSLTNQYPAAISGSQHVEIRPQLSGILTDVCVAEGATVTQGETLFIIDQVPYKAALQTATANVQLAKASVATAQLTADSKQELYDAKVVSDYDLQTAKNALQIAQATLAQAVAQEDIARNNLSYTVIKSPVAGVTGMTAYRKGALVTPAMATPLITVSNNQQMYAYFSLTEKQMLALSRQNGELNNVMEQMPEVKLRLNDGTMYNCNGKIDAISGVVDATTGAISIRATFANEQGVLRSGGVGNIVFPYEKKDCIVIPQVATFELQDKVFVYRVIDGKAVATSIVVFEINDGKEYIVEEGLQVGEVIIAEGAGLVRDGAEIQPIQ